MYVVAGLAPEKNLTIVGKAVNGSRGAIGVLGRYRCADAGRSCPSALSVPQKIQILPAPLIEPGLLLAVATGFLESRGAHALDLASQTLDATLQIRALHLQFRWKRMIVAPAFQIRVRRVAVVLVNAPLLHVAEEGRQ